jgi:hypothetical protein
VPNYTHDRRRGCRPSFGAPSNGASRVGADFPRYCLNVSVETTIRVGDRVLCDEGATWGSIRAILIEPEGRRFDRVVIEPLHRVAVGQFVPAEKLTFVDGVLTFDGYLAFFDLHTRAEEPQWLDSHSGIPVLKGGVIPVDGLIILDGDTPVTDQVGDSIGTVVGISFDTGEAVDSPRVEKLLIRIRARFRRRDVFVDMAQQVDELGPPVRLGVPGEEILRKQKW